MKPKPNVNSIFQSQPQSSPDSASLDSASAPTTEFQLGLEHRLEIATSEQNPPGAQLDPETAVLRDGWQVLGQLLTASDAEAEMKAITILESGSRRRGNRQWIMAVGVAASLLLVAGLAWWISGRGANDVVNNGAGKRDAGQSGAEKNGAEKNGAGDNVATPAPRKPRQSLASAESSVHPVPSVNRSVSSAPIAVREQPNWAAPANTRSSAALSWDDQFDTDFATVNQQLISVQADWKAASDPWQMMASRIEEFSQAWDDGSL